jgi:hypothetical protein
MTVAVRSLFVPGGYAPYLTYCLVGAANLALAGLCFAAQEGRPDLALYGVYAAMLVWLAVAWWSWYGATGRLADAYWLLALAVWLFNGGGLALTQVVRPDAGQALREFYHPVFRSFTTAGLVSAFVLVLFCLSAMHAGALLAASRWPKREAESVPAAAEQDPSLFWIGLGLIAVSIGPALWMLWVSAARVREGGYMALYQADGGAEEGLIFMLASGLVPGALYLMGSDLDNRALRRIGWALVLTFSVGVLALGTRAAFFQNVAALLWLRHFGVRPLGKAVWAGLIAAGLFLSTAVFWAREAAMQSAASRQDVRGDVEEASSGPATALNEMGSSVMTVVYTLDLVPAVRGFAWGETYAASLLATVPGLTDGRETEEAWLTHTVSPETAAVGGGLGFSFIAEAYLNFGVGAPVFLGLVGFLLGSFAGWVHAAGQSGRLAFAACVISIMLFGARASSLSFARRILVLCVLPYAASVVLRFLEARYESRTRPAPH